MYAVVSNRENSPFPRAITRVRVETRNSVVHVPRGARFALERARPGDSRCELNDTRSAADESRGKHSLAADPLGLRVSERVLNNWRSRGVRARSQTAESAHTCCNRRRRFAHASLEAKLTRVLACAVVVVELISPRKRKRGVSST